MRANESRRFLADSGRFRRAGARDEVPESGWYLREAGFGERVLKAIKATVGGRGRWKDEKEMVAALVRNRTALTNRWVVARLGMGHEVSVTRAVRRFRDDPKAARRLKALERKLGIY